MSQKDVEGSRMMMLYYMSIIYILCTWNSIEFSCVILIQDLLQLMPWGCIIEMGREYDNTIGCTVVVSVSASWSRCSCLASLLLLPHVIWLICCIDYTILFLLCSIYSVDTLMYPYALPILTPLILSQVFA